ncbi:hypothetical protein GCM10023081_01750 [Arthrobacter ginkgonis]|uniref:Uncharacterized protein n=1 Tax=Arthrobacter ginkgonis TaxID=1630594 RepID=A0ABP7BPF1_9MICC
MESGALCRSGESPQPPLRPVRPERHEPTRSIPLVLDDESFGSADRGLAVPPMKAPGGPEGLGSWHPGLGARFLPVAGVA